jgi:hypothetical protein
MSDECVWCGSTSGCLRDTGLPCTALEARQIEARYGYGSPGDHRAFWD